MPKIALKVKSAIELLIINYYYWSCCTTKMQMETKGIWNATGETRQISDKCPALMKEELEHKSQEQGEPLQPMEEERTDMKYLEPRETLPFISTCTRQSLEGAGTGDLALAAQQTCIDIKMGWEFERAQKI